MLSVLADSNIFARQREEQKTLLRHIASLHTDYAKQYKLLQVGLLKILELLRLNRDALATDSQYDPKRDGFPRTEPLIEAVTTVLENTCLFADLVLHSPDMSAKILQRPAVRDWRALLAWSTELAEHFYATVIDANSQKMLGLFDQEINAERRQPDYVNPYRVSEKPATSNKTKKAKRKIPKGPQMTNRNEL